MRKLYVPKSESELIVLKSLLDSEGINYFVHNDYFGSLEVGPSIDYYNTKTIMVAEDQYDWAAKVLSSFVTNKGTKKGRISQPRYTLLDKIRMTLEAFSFAWFMPGRMRRKKK